MVALALLLLAPGLTLPSVAHRPQLARHSQLQLLASASPKEEITPTAGLSVANPTAPTDLTAVEGLTR